MFIMWIYSCHYFCHYSDYCHVTIVTATATILTIISHFISFFNLNLYYTFILCYQIHPFWKNKLKSRRDIPIPIVLNCIGILGLIIKIKTFSFDFYSLIQFNSVSGIVLYCPLTVYLC